MSDGQSEAPVIDAGTTPDPNAGKSQDAKSYIAPDGSFNEGWTEILDEEIRNEPSLKTHKNLKTLAKTFVNAQRMVGKNKIAIPNEKSTEGEWNEFYKALGRPETVEDYQFKRPDELPEEFWNDDFAKAAKTLFHKIGLTKKQADALFNFNSANVMNTIKTQQQQEEMNMQQLQSELYNEWGGAYQQKIHLGNAAIEEGTTGNQELKDKIVQKYGNDPDFIRFASNLGSKFAEHKGPNFAAIPTPSDIQAQIDEAMQTDAYRNGLNPGHKAAVIKVNQLFEAKAKHGKPM